MKKIFTNNLFLLIVISINALLIFLQGFYNPNEPTAKILEILDHLCTVIFIIEAAVKIISWGGKVYFSDAWNIFDFILILIAIPSLIVWLTPLQFNTLGFLLTLRILRVFKFFRLLKFVPNVEGLMLGVLRAIRSSVFILLAFLVFNFIFAILSFSFFSKAAPEYFSNPLISFYTTFKVFTIEGWYEIPDLIAERTDSIALAVFARIYFVCLLFGGGIFGLSLINSIFVDSMMSDNNNEIEKKIQSLEQKIDILIKNSKQ